MTTSVLPPKELSEIADLKRRVYDLERRLRQLEIGDPPQDILSFPGPTSAQSGPVFEPTTIRNYHELLVTQRVAATSSFTFRLVRSDVTFGTYTIPANTVRVSFRINFQVSTGQDLYGQIASSGSGGVDLLAHLRY